MKWNSTSERAEALSESEFVERLRARGTHYYDRHPFHQLMHRGDLSQKQLAGWAANRFCYQRSIPLKDAAILSNCPDRDVRRRWIQRIHDHDGDAENPGGLETWLMLAQGLGLTREEVVDERHVLPGVRFACEAYIDFCRRKPWVEAVASSLTELFAPDLMNRRITAFEEKYAWIDPTALTYFRGRLTQAPRDSQHGLEIVVAHCRTREEQERALAALDFKLDVLWSLLDTVHYHYVVLAETPDVASAANRGARGEDRLAQPKPVGATAG